MSDGNAGGRAHEVGAAVFETLFDRALDPVLILAMDGSVVRANAAAAYALGWRLGDLVGKRRDELVVMDDPMRDAIETRQRTGAASAEVTVRRANGTTFPAEIHSAVVKEGPEPLAYVMFRDLTAERVAARALVESEQRFLAVFDLAPVAMAISKIPETTYVAANDAWRALFEVGDVDVAGKTGADLGLATEEEWLRARDIFLRWGSFRGREVVRRTRSGRELQLLLGMEPLSIGGKRHVISFVQPAPADAER
ncbi:MAG: PAS domain-containing protein [Anaeromyxobacteraceae bacterium]